MAQLFGKLSSMVETLDYDNQTERNLDSLRTAGNRRRDLEILEQNFETLRCYYQDDKSVSRLEIDVDKRVSAHRNAFFHSSACLIPCFSLLINVTCCPTLYLYTCFPRKEKQVADAHRVTLRERTILHEIDSHIGYTTDRRTHMQRGHENNLPTICEPWPSVGCCGFQVDELKQIIRLVDITSITLIQSSSLGNCTGAEYLPEHLVIKSKSGEMVSIASPKNGREFIAAVRNQISIVQETQIDCNPPRLNPVSNHNDNLFNVLGGAAATIQMNQTHLGSSPRVQEMMNRALYMNSEYAAKTGTPVEIAEAELIVEDPKKSVADQLSQLGTMHEIGDLTDDEFAKAKSMILS